MKTASPPKLLTPQQAHAGFLARGENVSEFARQHGLRPTTVFQVLYGRKKGMRGDAYRAAVLLGIRRGQV